MIKITWKLIKHVLKNNSWVVGEILLVVGGSVLIPFFFGMMGLTLSYWSGTFGTGMMPYARTALFFETLILLTLPIIVGSVVAYIGVSLMRRSRHYDKKEESD